MTIEKAIIKAKEIDGDTYVDCQELIYEVFQDFDIQFTKEQLTNIENEKAKSIVIKGLRQEVKKQKLFGMKMRDDAHRLNKELLRIKGNK